MRLVLKYTVFETGWGYFGLLVRGGAIVRTCLPGVDEWKVIVDLLSGIDVAEHDGGILREVQEKIIAYFEGERVEFDRDIRIELGGVSDFQRRVLTACRGIGFGQRVSYSQLAKRVGSAGAARAVGGVMARNAIPLIVPCHRVVRSDGGLGGFSAVGGVGLKKRLLAHEEAIIKRGE